MPPRKLPPLGDEPTRRVCRAHSSRTGKPCKQAPIIGGTVCRHHGGAAPQVKAMAAKRIRDMLADAIDPDRAMRETASIAYSDLREIFDDAGALRPPKDWPAHLAAAIASLKVAKRNLTSGDGIVDDVIEVKLWDKPKAVEMLMKHHGKLKDHVEHSGHVVYKWEGEGE